MRPAAGGNEGTHSIVGRATGAVKAGAAYGRGA
jgi:hypothetical protein